MLLNIFKKEQYFIVPFCFFVVFISGCAPKLASNQVRFAVKECYNLDEGEVQVPVDENATDVYEPFYLVGNYQMPLNRLFSAKNYVTFIGLALSNKPHELVNAHYTTSALKVIDTLNGTYNEKSNSIFFKQDSIFVFRLIYAEPVQKITTVVNFVSKDSTLIDNFFNNKDGFIRKKIGCKD